MKLAVPLLFLTCFINVCAFGASTAAEDAQNIKYINQQYGFIEEQLPRAVHYLRQQEKDGVTITEQAWLSEARDLLKVSTDRHSAAGRELTEITLVEGDAPVFVLTRHETPAADGATLVEESRLTIAQVQLIRLLTKKATFPAGDPMDTVKVKNTTVDVARLPEKERECHPYFKQARSLLKSLVAAGPPERDPATVSPGDSARYRLIRQTASDDGRFALAVGFPIGFDWSSVADSTGEETVFPSYVEGAEGLGNYIIDLTTHRMLGATGVAYFGTRHRYNHRSVTASWSPKNRFFMQTFDSKWNTDEAAVGWIDQEHQKAAAVDLLKPAGTQAYLFLASKKSPAYRKHGRNFTLNVACDDIFDDGTLSVDVTGEIPKSEEANSDFHVVLRFRIKRAGDKATLQFLDAKMGKAL